MSHNPCLVKLIADALPKIADPAFHVSGWPQDEKDLHRSFGPEGTDRPWRSFDERNEAVDYLRRWKAAEAILDALEQSEKEEG